MDAPYRLEKLLSETMAVFGRSIPATLAFDMTLPEERVLHAPIGQIAKEMKDHKGEFILIVHNHQ
jgi:16S rRNA C1402 (ribose-2'-O) methylase RsmI